MSMSGVQKRPAGDDTASSTRAAGDSSAQVPSALESTPAKHWAKVHRTAIASGVSSVCSTLTAFPLDSVKTRMQAYRYQHFTDCVQHTYKTEGIKGFWREGFEAQDDTSKFIVGFSKTEADLDAALGAFAPIFSITLVRTTSFSIYQKAKYKYSAAIGRATGGDEPLVIVNRPGSTPTLSTMACFGAAGATAGAFISILACPFELTKLSAQISTLMAKSNHSSMDDPILRSSYLQKGTIRTAKNIVLNRGLLGLYSGFGFHLMRDTIGTTLYFSTYESTKQILVKFQKSDNPTSPLAVATAGGLCGLVSWVCIYPIDTAKTHYQRNCLSKHKGQPVTMPKIQFFNRKMYTGLGVSMARSCVINTIFFSSFEHIKKKINSLPDSMSDILNVD